MSGYSSTLIKKKLINLRHIVPSGSHGNNEAGVKETFNILSFLINHLQGLPPVESNDVIREVVDFIPSPELKIKKLVYHLLSLYSGSEELMLNAYNGVRDDRNDPNPIIRAISVVLSLRCLDENDSEMEDLLEDSNCGVKIKALTKIAAGERINTELLLDMIERETEAEVVVLCLCCLATSNNIDEACCARVQNILVSLLTKGHLFKSDYLVYVLLYATNKMLVVDKLSDDEKFQIMNCLENFRLNKSSYHVVIETYRLMLNLCQGLEAHVNDSVTELLIESLVEQYKVLSQQTKTILLKIVIEVCQSNNNAKGFSSIDDNLDCFCPQPNDLDELKIEKLNFLSQIVSQSNSAKIFSFVVSFLTYHENHFIVESAFDVIKRLYKHQTEKCWRVVSSLASSGHRVVLEQSVNCMAFIFAHQNDSDSLNKAFLITPHLSHLVSSFPDIKDQKSVDCALWLLSQNKEESLCEDLSSILVEVCEKDKMCLSSKVNLLNCCTRLFVSFPRHFAVPMKQILQKSVVNSGSLKDIALFYSSALKSKKFELLKKLLDTHETPNQDNISEDELLFKSTDQQFCSLKNIAVNWTF